MANYDKHGCQIPDQTPLSIPVGFKKPEDLGTMIARLIRLESAKAKVLGTVETFEEADDFDTDDDGDITSPYQVNEMRPERPQDAKNLEGREKLPNIEKNDQAAKDASLKADWEAFQKFRSEQSQKNSSTGPVTEPKNSSSS